MYLSEQMLWWRPWCLKRSALLVPSARDHLPPIIECRHVHILMPAQEGCAVRAGEWEHCRSAQALQNRKRGFCRIADPKMAARQACLLGRHPKRNGRGNASIKVSHKEASILVHQHSWSGWIRYVLHCILFWKLQVALGGNLWGKGSQLKKKRKKDRDVYKTKPHTS